MKRILITGTNSGCGKTTVTCAVLSALRQRGLAPVSFKCGPDYIDPMFHRVAIGLCAYNIDPFFLDGGGLRAHLLRRGGELAVIEGAMGYYDGIAASDEASAYTVARETRTPVVLVVNAKGAGNSLAAVIEGFTRHKSGSNIAGVIFNEANESRIPELTGTAEKTGVHMFGVMPKNPEWTLPGRHLGLLTAGEIAGLEDILSDMGRQASMTLDIDGLLKLAGSAPDLGTGLTSAPRRDRAVKLAVARDEAFCFIYEENLELLRELGCETVFFSPMRDKTLPVDIDGLYLCGGYPELYTEALSGNTPMLDSVRGAAEGGLPVIAEGGGFMYLHESIDGAPMCGVIHGEAYKTDRLRRFGYVTLTAERDNLLCKAGESIRSREFHYWDSTAPGEDFSVIKAGRGTRYNCAFAGDTMYAGFPQLYFPANPAFAENFVKRMAEHER